MWLQILVNAVASPYVDAAVEGDSTDEDDVLLVAGVSLVGPQHVRSNDVPQVNSGYAIVHSVTVQESGYSATRCGKSN
jgi:hypothetical protein